MIRKALGLLMLIAPAAVCIAACGDDDPVDKYPSPDAFCAALADTECSKETTEKCFVSAETCKPLRKSACLNAAAAASGRTYTSANVDACLKATTAAYATPGAKTALDAQEDACARVFAGAATTGSACNSEYACAAPLVCDLQKGRCATKTARTENADCNNAGDICNEGLFCDGPAGSRVCHKKKALGEACNPDAPCADNGFCNAGTCAALVGVGQPCTENAQCVTTYCGQAAKACGGRQLPTETGSCKDVGGAG